MACEFYSLRSDGRGGWSYVEGRYGGGSTLVSTLCFRLLPFYLMKHSILSQIIKLLKANVPQLLFFS